MSKKNLGGKSAIYKMLYEKTADIKKFPFAKKVFLSYITSIY
jgi:hypothetical protein